MPRMTGREALSVRYATMTGRRTPWTTAFVLAIGVEVRGFEPPTSSVRASWG